MKTVEQIEKKIKKVKKQLDAYDDSVNCENISHDMKNKLHRKLYRYLGMMDILRWLKNKISQLSL